MQSTYKILSLDGGGTWALLQVLTLQAIFNKKFPDKEIKGHEVLRHFDLVIGTSGGSMVLAALACNWTFDQIISIFDDASKRGQIFKTLSFKERYFPVNFMHLFGIKSIGTRYNTTNKKKALEDILVLDSGKKLVDIPLSELPEIIGKKSLELIVTTFDIKNRRAKFFRSNNMSKARAEIMAGHANFDETNLVTAIHGSSNAPVNYFDFPAVLKPKQTNRRYYLWDGALGGFNNPVMAGITEALANGVSRNTIRVLSIGTASKVASKEDSLAFRDAYYTTLLGRKLRFEEDGGIDFNKTKKKGVFSRLFKGSKLYTGALSSLSQSILFEPQTWATYSAYIHLFADDLEAPNNLSNFVRLSPQIIVDHNDSNILKRLYHLDMDVTEQSEIEDLKECYRMWRDGLIINEPIQWTKTIDEVYIHAKGHRLFSDALEAIDWL